MTRRQIFELPAALAALSLDQPLNAQSPTGFSIGVCSYTFREFQRKMAIGMMKQMGISTISVKDVHLSYSLPHDDLVKAAAEFRKAGLTLASAGNTTLTSEDPTELRRYFEYARTCGIPMLIAAPTHASLPLVEKLVKEFDIKIAIHTHGPEDKNFPSPSVVLDAVKSMDPRVGLCMDVGHSMRTGADVVAEIAHAGPRLLDLHMKDLKRADDKDSQCEVGEGVMPVVEIFRHLRAINYGGSVNLEYEINGENPLPGAQHSIGYLKGVAAALAA